MTDYVDLNFQGVPHTIATAIVKGTDGVALVDPGPTSCLGSLNAGLAALGIGLDEVRHVLLTHIHLDHAGASGTLAALNPAITVWVHERGARHMVDPRRLLESATRLYGDQMDSLWGEFLAVPEPQLRVLAGGERIDVAGRRLEVAYTPGHASHHVAYFDADSGVAYCGDVAGIRIGDAPFVMAPTPPPDIDLGAWRASIDAVRAWHPDTLFLTHFGPHTGTDAHLDALIERLEAHATLAQRLRATPMEEVEREQAFAREVSRDLRAELSEASARAYELAVPSDHCYRGLARYWSKQEQGGRW